MKKYKAIVNEIFCWSIKRNSIFSLFFLFVFELVNSRWQNYKIVPLKWMDCENISYKGILRIKQNSKSFGPMCAESGKQIIAEVEIPELYYRIFVDGQISVESSSVYVDGEILVERVGRGEQKRFNYACGQVIVHGESSALVKCGNQKIIQRGIFLGGNGSFNYYHWLIEIIPKLEFLEELPSEIRQYPLLIPERAKNITSFSEILKIVSNEREIIYLNSINTYLVKHLVFIDAPNNLPFNLIAKERFNVTDFLFRKDSLDYIRKTFLSGIDIKTKSNSSYRKKIFLARSENNSNRKYNQNEVMVVLERLGFKAIFMERLSFKEQVKTINNADWIVGPTGASWANIIFAKKGTNCLCWMAEQYGEFSAFSNIAAHVGTNLKYLKFDVPVKCISDLYMEGYSVDISELEKTLVSV